MGSIELIMEPKVPPRVKAAIPQKMKVNSRSIMIAKRIRDIVNRSEEMPRVSRLIDVFFVCRYFRAISNSYSLRSSSSPSEFDCFLM